MNHQDRSLPQTDLLTTIVDNAGVSRAKLLPADRVESVSKKGIGLSPAFATICVDDSIAVINDSSPVGDMRLVPDLEAAVPLTPHLSWAPADQLDQELSPMPTCQRSAARRLDEDARRNGYEYLMAFEYEFTVFKRDASGLRLGHDGPGYGLAAFLELEAFLLDLLHDLQYAGVKVEQIHPEYGKGQLELSVAPSSPVQAADTSVLVRLIARRVALQHNLMVSFSPITVSNGIGNGAHLHFSASTSKGNVFSNGDLPFNMSQSGAHMIAGLHENLASVTALLAPSVLSFDRLAPGMWSGAWACWGLENREAALRFIKGTTGYGDSSANCEVKIVDPAANPYLVVATVLALTQHGVINQVELKPPVVIDPSLVPVQDRLEKGIEQLPSSQQLGLEFLKANTVMREALGGPLVEAFVAVHAQEQEKFSALDKDTRIDLHLWKY
ncbi:glutamine synthetase [Paenarthrobacter sp. NPDC090517]|uniref:glutamine synthetase n=1 Tax=Paenarthrobacter sp. NPDC090517 TaxID=3364381 RepID=UPI003811BD18